MIFVPTGSSHSDKEIDTPEKIIPKSVPVERKRPKRKADDGSSGGGGNPSSSAKSSKKINDYFTSKVTGSSPVRHSGSKSPSPHQSIKSMVIFL